MLYLCTALICLLVVSLLVIQNLFSQLGELEKENEELNSENECLYEENEGLLADLMRAQPRSKDLDETREE